LRDEATPEQLIVLAKLCGSWLIENGYEKDASWVLPGVDHFFTASKTRAATANPAREYVENGPELSESRHSPLGPGRRQRRHPGAS